MKNNKNGTKNFNVKFFLLKAYSVILFFYNKPKLFLSFFIVIFILVCILNSSYFYFTGFPKEFTIFIFTHRLFTIYPFIAVLAPSVLIYLNPEAVRKPRISELFFLGLNNITFSGFILYFFILLFYYYTGFHLIILAYFLPLLGDLFANLPNILGDFVKLHSLSKNMVSLLHNSKPLYFSQTAHLLKTKVNLNTEMGSRKIINSKYTPHLGLSQRFLPCKCLSGIAKTLVDKQVFKSPLYNTGVSLVKKGAFRPFIEIKFGRQNHVALLSLKVVQCNKTLCSQSATLQLNDLKSEKGPLNGQSLKSF